MPWIIDAEAFAALLEERIYRFAGEYGDLAGAVSGCLKLLRAQPTIEQSDPTPTVIEKTRENRCIVCHAPILPGQILCTICEDKYPCLECPHSDEKSRGCMCAAYLEWFHEQWSLFHSEKHP